MSKVRGVRAASSQIKFELPLLYLITAWPCAREHGQMRGAQLHQTALVDAYVDLGTLTLFFFFPQQSVCS